MTIESLIDVVARGISDLIQIENCAKGFRLKWDGDDVAASLTEEERNERREIARTAVEALASYLANPPEEFKVLFARTLHPAFEPESAAAPLRVLAGVLRNAIGD